MPIYVLEEISKFSGAIVNNNGARFYKSLTYIKWLSVYDLSFLGSSSSEAEVCSNAHYGDIRHLVGLSVTLHGNGVGSRWGIGWNIPADVVLEGGVVMVGHGDVLVIEGGPVPVDMDVNVVDINSLGDDSSEHERDLGSLNNWVWGVGSLLGVKSESTGIIITLKVGNSTEVVWSLHLSALDEALHKVLGEEVLWGEDVNVSVRSRNTRSNECSVSKFVHIINFVI